MKKFIFLMTLLLASVAVLHAAPVLEEYVPIKQIAASEEPVRGENFWMLPILSKQTITVKLWIENEEKGDAEEYIQLIKDSYNAWFSHAANEIYAQGRAAEFADVLPYLKRGADISIIKASEPEIYVEPKKGEPIVYANPPYINVWKDLDTLKTHCGNDPSAKGCQHLGGIEVTKALKSSERKNNLIHEIGHNLGFEDQYMGGRLYSHPVFSSYDFTNTIMYDSRKGLQCGDVDRIINLIDLTLHLQRNGGKPWKSFCPDSEETFVGGMSSYAGPYVFSHLPGAIVLDRYEKGEVVSREVFPFTKEPFDVWAFVEPVKVEEYDGAGRAVHLKGSQGEDIYYMLWQNYDRIEQLVVKDGKVLYFQLAHEFFFKSGISNFLISKDFFAGNKVARIQGQYGDFLRTAHYEEKGADDKNTFEMILQFLTNKKRSLKVEWYGDFYSSVMTPRIQATPTEHEMISDLELSKNTWAGEAKIWAEQWIHHINPCQKGRSWCKEQPPMGAM